MKIRILYGNGSVEELRTDHETLEGFANEKFGSAWDAFVEGGGRIELLDEVPEADLADPVVDPVAPAQADGVGEEVQVPQDQGQSAPDEVPQDQGQAAPDEVPLQEDAEPSTDGDAGPV